MRSKRSTCRPTSASTPVITSSGKGIRTGTWQLAVAPLVVGACYAAAAVPPTKSVPPSSSRAETTAVMSVTPVVESTVDQPGEPIPELKEEVEPKVEPVAVGFTRRIDRAKIEVRGAPHAKVGLDVAVMRAAATFDNEAWSGEPRRELLAYLRGGVVATAATFTDADARIVAQLQSGSGAFADGKLRDETMAVLFAMGFRFSAPKAMPSEVRLDFYPGELEDLDAWNREIDDSVTKNGLTFRYVNPPVGEGSIYVRVGRSIVACYRGRGGPPFPIQDDGKHVAEPTKRGAYRLGPAHAHVTPNWYFSQIPWGAEIRKKDGGYQYRWPGRSEWSWATSNPAGKLKEPLGVSDFAGLPEVTRDGETFLIWNKNDFGPIAWGLVPGDLYVHTTPDTEAATNSARSLSLSSSHGCVHLDPRERDEMMKSGYLGAGIPFSVRAWDEHVLPDQVRHDMVKGTDAAARPLPTPATR